jgi:hypothetical protein
MDLPVDYNNLKSYERRAVREEYIKQQNNDCYYCGNPLDKLPSVKIQRTYIHLELFPDDFFKYPVHLHHNHETGLTIGAVHSRCNAVLWQYHKE